MASGRVLEETYRKWVQYKGDCVKMIENEPLLQGTEIVFSVCVMSIILSCKKVRGIKRKRKKTSILLCPPLGDIVTVSHCLPF